MAASTDRPAFRLHHPTVVPENFDEDDAEE